MSLLTSRRIGKMLLVFSLGITPAWAGGLYVREFGQPNQATSGAGGNVFAEDASTAFQNPSGLFNLENDSNWMVTGVVVNSKVEFETTNATTVPGDDGGDAGDTLFGGALFHTRRLSDRWGVALSLNSISGSAVDYGDSFAGRYLGYETELMTVTFTPSLAYKVNDVLSVAVGVPMLYGELDLTAAIPPLLGPPTASRDGKAEIENGDDFSAALSVSALWQVNDQFRLGAGWIGENELTFDGDLKLTLPGIDSGTAISNIATDVEITLPQTAAVSGAWFFNDQLTLTSRLSWEQWSELDSVPISTNEAGAAIPLDWDDIWSIALGLRYKTDGAVTWYTGAGYDTDPTQPEDRVPILPADEQWRLSGGFTYALKNDRKVGVSLTYLDLGDARIDQTTDVGRFAGDYDKNRVIFLGLNYAF
jgi:long-chain fatty acid transport protein